MCTIYFYFYLYKTLQVLTVDPANKALDVEWIDYIIAHTNSRSIARAGDREIARTLRQLSAVFALVTLSAAVTAGGVPVPIRIARQVSFTSCGFKELFQPENNDKINILCLYLSLKLWKILRVAKLGDSTLISSP